jgi:hypothetical protein
MVDIGSTADEWDGLPLTPEHAAYLRDKAAITASVAKDKGLRSITEVDQLPDWASWAGTDAVPCIVFPWVDTHGNVTEQLRPDAEFERLGESYKYLFPKGAGAVLNALRHNPEAKKVLIVEGTKQGLAVASWAPDDVAVYGVGGCRNWFSEGIPDADLEVCDGKEVFILLDADVATNRDVYDAAVKLGTAAKAEGADVGRVRTPGRPAAPTGSTTCSLRRRPTGVQASSPTWSRWRTRPSPATPSRSPRTSARATRCRDLTASAGG